MNEITAQSKGNRELVPVLAEHICRTNCKLCMSKYREDTEQFYERNQNYSAARNFLQSKLDSDGEGETITIAAVRNHLIYHYGMEMKNLNLSEYSKELQQWVDMQDNKLFAMKKRLAVLEREMMVLSSESESLSNSERRKNAETVTKIINTMNGCEEKIIEMEKQYEPVLLIINQLKIIITDELEHNSDIRTKKVLCNVLDKLEQTVTENEDSK